ncbi:MAG: cryptochrome/photolyase family protein [Acidimicrobiia bacterium]
MNTALVVFSRDLRIGDHPALAAAAAAEHVVPAFIFDASILQSSFNCANRTGFLLDALADLDAQLRELGAALMTRQGVWVDEVMRLVHDTGAQEIHLSLDTSAYATKRYRALEDACAQARIALHVHPGINVVTPGAVSPSGGGDHFKVFTPYWRAWEAVPLRAIARTPKRLALPPNVSPNPLPTIDALVRGSQSPEVMRGGELVARARLNAWVKTDLAVYDEIHNDLPGDRTSRLSPYLHFGCISPTEIVHKLRGRPGAEPFIRQLCWRDFYQQVLAARPDAAWADYKHRGDYWNTDPDALEAWKAGQTGFPVVDAGMRQLQREGFMHNRTRMIVASFLTKDLGIDWRVGAAHFLDWLIDGDIASNNLNWQWTAGTGTDTNPHRIFNPTVQGQRFDPNGEYIRRYVPELHAVHGKAIHEPHLLAPAVQEALAYPAPIVDHHEAIAEYRARRKM